MFFAIIYANRFNLYVPGVPNLVRIHLPSVLRCLLGEWDTGKCTIQYSTVPTQFTMDLKGWRRRRGEETCHLISPHLLYFYFLPIYIFILLFSLCLTLHIIILKISLNVYMHLHWMIWEIAMMMYINKIDINIWHHLHLISIFYNM